MVGAFPSTLEWKVLNESPSIVALYKRLNLLLGIISFRKFISSFETTILLTFSLNINVPSDPNDESSPEEEKEFLIHFWDTAGQERFRSITTGYFKQSHGLILLYDITNKTSFDNLEKWINAVTDTLGKNNKKYGLILLGNKVDLENKRKIQSEEAEEVCKNNNIHWAGEVSVQEMTLDELNEKFEEFVKYIYSIVGKGEDDKKPIIRKLSSPQKSAKKKEKLCC